MNGEKNDNTFFYYLTVFFQLEKLHSQIRLGDIPGLGSRDL